MRRQRSKQKASSWTPQRLGESHSSSVGLEEADSSDPVRRGMAAPNTAREAQAPREDPRGALRSCAPHPR